MHRALRQEKVGGEHEVNHPLRRRQPGGWRSGLRRAWGGKAAVARYGGERAARPEIVLLARRARARPVRRWLRSDRMRAGGAAATAAAGTSPTSCLSRPRRPGCTCRTSWASSAERGGGQGARPPPARPCALGHWRKPALIAKRAGGAAGRRHEPGSAGREQERSWSTQVAPSRSRSFREPNATRMAARSSAMDRSAP